MPTGTEEGRKKISFLGDRDETSDSDDSSQSMDDHPEPHQGEEDHQSWHLDFDQKKKRLLRAATAQIEGIISPTFERKQQKKVIPRTRTRQLHVTRTTIPSHLKPLFDQIVRGEETVRTEQHKEECRVQKETTGDTVELKDLDHQDQGVQQAHILHEIALLKRIVVILLDKSRGLTLKDRVVRFRRYKNCFIGYRLISWLIAYDYAKTRDEALELGKRLEVHGFIRGLSKPHLLDAFEVYEFTDDAILTIGDNQLRASVGTRELDQFEKKRLRFFPRDFLALFPISMFTTSLGTVSLGLVYQNVFNVFDAEEARFGAWALYLLGILIYLLSLIIYIAKVIFRFSEAAKDWNGPITRNLFSSFSMTTLLISLACFEVDDTLAEVVFWIGTVIQSLFSLEIIGSWVLVGRNIPEFNPTYFLPVVGLSLVATPAARLGYTELGWLYLGAAFFYWLSLFIILLLRLIFFDPFEPKLVPSIFITIAPPALLFGAYSILANFQLNGIDFSGRILFAMELLTFALVVRIRSALHSKDWSFAWWAYTFPLNAFATAWLIYGNALGQPLSTTILSIACVALSTCVWLVVFFSTFYHLANWELFIPKNI